MSFKQGGRFCRTGLKFISLMELATLLLLACCGNALAQLQSDERIVPERATIDWATAAEDAQALSPHLNEPAVSEPLPEQYRAHLVDILSHYAIQENMAPLARLNALVAPTPSATDKGDIPRHCVDNSLLATVYDGIATVPVPVLLPVQTARLLSARMAAFQEDASPVPSFLSASIESMSFLPGYNALMTVSEEALRNLAISVLAISVAEKPQLHIGVRP
jgi:hypothetical protein